MMLTGALRDLGRGLERQLGRLGFLMALLTGGLFALLHAVL